MERERLGALSCLASLAVLSRGEIQVLDEKIHVLDLHCPASARTADVKTREALRESRLPSQPRKGRGEAVAREALATIERTKVERETRLYFYWVRSP
jgi:hypothetical protein